MDEDEMHRKELSRLLSTAKDKDRQDLILKAIHALDEQEKVSAEESMQKSLNFHGMSPSMHASLFLGENMPMVETVTMTPGGSARMRPMSARRRPSVPNLLDAIPEMAPKHQLVNRNEEIVMPVEDIAEVVASSYDRRFPPKNIFRHSSHLVNSSGGGTGAGTGLNKSNEFNSIAGDGLGHNSYGAYTPELSFINNHAAAGTLSTSNSNSNLNSGGNSMSGNHSVIVPVAQRRANSFKEKGKVRGWISTGTVPQFLHVAFFEKWEIKKIEVFCSGIEKLCLQICATATSALKNSASMTEMVHMGKGAFVWDAGGSEDTFDKDVGGLPGISVTFLVRGTNSLFIHVSEIRIIVHPYT